MDSGFERYYSDLKAAVETQFPGKVNVLPIRDEDLTGNFEVTLVETQQLIHSKTKKGMGRCESPEERERLFAIVQLYLDYAAKSQRQ